MKQLIIKFQVFIHPYENGKIIPNYKKREYIATNICNEEDVENIINNYIKKNDFVLIKGDV